MLRHFLLRTAVFKVMLLGLWCQLKMLLKLRFEYFVSEIDFSDTLVLGPHCQKIRKIIAKMLFKIVEISHMQLLQFLGNFLRINAKSAPLKRLEAF